MNEIDEDMEEARENADIGRQEKLASDRAALLAKLRIAGFKRSSRRNNADLNRLRNSVCNAVKRSMTRIKNCDPQAFEHLTANISFGFSLVYRSTPGIVWSS